MPLIRLLGLDNLNIQPDAMPDGLFDFGFKINEESVYAFNQTGTYQFFDLMRPWIAGNVTVVGEN